MDSFKNPFRIIALLLTGFLILTCTQDQAPTEPLIDYISPTVEWLYPPGGSELSGVVELRFSVYDEGGIDSACVYINGSLFGEGGHSCLSFCTDTLFTLSWNTLDFADGVYILEVRAWDEAGNLGTSPSLLVNVRNGDEPPPEDRMPPDVWWAAPDPGSMLADTVRLRLGIFDEVGVDSVLLLKNGASVTTIIPSYYCRGSSTTIPPYYCGCDSTNIPPYYCRGGQRGGRSTCAGKVTSNARYDKPAQQAVQATRPMYDRPAQQAVQAIPPYYCRGGQRGGQIKSASSRPIGVTASNPPLPPPSIEGGDVEGYVDYLWDTRTDSDGVYVWEARAWDDSGNMGTSPALLVRVKNNPEPPPEDTSPPVVSWCSPEPGDTLEGTVELRFQVLDDVMVDSVKVYLNGREWQKLIDSGQYLDCHVNWITCEYPDGNYIVEVRAWDSSGNMGIGVGVVFTVWNNRPRLIWVPDDYEKIQDAIWNSENGDTIMVRSGNYNEQLQFFNKNVSLVSESGPEETIINGTGFYVCAWITGGQDTNMVVCGFTFKNLSDFRCYGLTISGGASPKVFNNIFTSPGIDGRGFRTSQTYGLFRNNLIVDCGQSGVSFAHSWGDFSNNMVLKIGSYCFWNAANNGQPLIADYNLFWDFRELIGHKGDMIWGENNITDQEPIFVEGSYRLREGSPGIDQGRPDLSDPDGSRSDIGVYGGPYTY